ncbi:MULTISPECIES: hypothetical protein [Sphingobacterium]|uniref:Uncharacterized protein n=1 Tax=Sphingobacterium kitahiroshimense TaxID=470446 RepID=A0ABV0BP03_9SPHI|nr:MULTISPECIES: hypothetical protein [unclassified Sphingobacterium]MBB2952221.1 LytS/YehU family sensor histidine kinase [Sphingobacterium sp. JUb56]QQD13914.1 hypothetical protein JAZ75_25605 [Sphingobacterium sp. UDSM-2020]
MDRLWNRLWSSKVPENLHEQWKDKAKLSFVNSQFDVELIRGCLDKIKDDPKNTLFLQAFLAYQDIVSQLETQNSAEAEIDFMERYVFLFSQISAVDLSVVWTKKIEYPTLSVPRFILLPLVQNALWQGYHAAEKYPMKIKISVFEKIISLDITNHVNHHIVDQKVNDSVENYQARLQYEFGDQHTLIMNSNAHTFRANLTLRF